MQNKTIDQALEKVTKVQIVSRETICNFIAYGELLEKWNKTVNLVGKSTLADFWDRHVLDSLQLYRYIESPETQIIADLGSGAGFPGMILAMAGAKHMHLIESDARKCAFLSEVAARTHTKITIHNCRIETFQQKVDGITARALAPLTELINYGKDILNPSGKMILLKGQDWQNEITTARNAGFSGAIADYPSLTDAAARVLVVDVEGSVHA
jgi:16S rRNA (guanine527-N7)-methyltransferase